MAEDSSEPKDDELKTREGWLREEVKNHRTLLFSLIQWGMAILAGVESALYFVRRDLAQALTNKPFVIPAEVMPFGHWFGGTFIVTSIACLFSFLFINLLNRYYSYRDQLSDAACQYSKIDDSKVKRKYRWIPLLFMWAFPAIDLVIWLTYHKKSLP